jgi:hypothetical protein
VNYKVKNILFKNHQIKYLLRIFFLLVLLFVVIRLENFLYTTEDDNCYPILENNELVISEQPAQDFILNTYNKYCDYHESLISHVYGTSILHSYKIATYSYSSLLLVKFKTLITKPIGNSNIISILQNCNIWHTSSEEGPTQVS